MRRLGRQPFLGDEDSVPRIADVEEHRNTTDGHQGDDEEPETNGTVERKLYF